MSCKYMIFFLYADSYLDQTNSTPKWKSVRERERARLCVREKRERGNTVNPLIKRHGFAISI